MKLWRWIWRRWIRLLVVDCLKGRICALMNGRVCGFGEPSEELGLGLSLRLEGKVCWL